jgi:hypothetical protein
LEADAGERVALRIGGYLDEGPLTDRWMFGSAPADDGTRPFTITLARRTLSSWLNMVIACGLLLLGVAEPFADEQTAAEHPDVADTRVARTSRSCAPTSPACVARVVDDVCGHGARRVCAMRPTGSGVVVR